jgi:hypothetical protein
VGLLIAFKALHEQELQQHNCYITAGGNAGTQSPSRGLQVATPQLDCHSLASNRLVGLLIAYKALHEQELQQDNCYITAGGNADTQSLSRGLQVATPQLDCHSLASNRLVGLLIAFNEVSHFIVHIYEQNDAEMEVDMETSHLSRISRIDAVLFVNNQILL